MKTPTIRPELWRSLAFEGYSAFSAHGRCLIAARLDPANQARHIIFAGDLANAPFPSVEAEALVNRYDPDFQIVLATYTTHAHRVAIIDPPPGCDPARDVFEDHHRLQAVAIIRARSGHEAGELAARALAKRELGAADVAALVRVGVPAEVFGDRRSIMIALALNTVWG